MCTLQGRGINSKNGKSKINKKGERGEGMGEIGIKRLMK
jgi:hypothetical protein